MIFTKQALTEKMSGLLFFDWQETLRMSNNNSSLAAELLDIFIACLPYDVVTIERNAGLLQYPELLASVHKLHNGLCYVVFLRLKFVVYQLESFLLFNNQENAVKTDTVVNLVALLVEEGQKIINTDFAEYLSHKTTT